MCVASSGRACIVAVPAAALQRGVPGFKPPLPPRKAAAAAALRTDAATKLLYTFRQRLWDEQLTFLAHTGDHQRRCC